MDTSQLLVVLQELLSAANVKSIEDFNWAVSPFTGGDTYKKNPLSWCLDTGESQAGVIFFHTYLLVLFRLWLWKAAAAMMPGGSDLWLREFAREMDRKHAADVQMESCLFDAEFAMELLQETVPFASDVVMVERSQGYDLPRPRGTNQHSQLVRCMALDDECGNITWIALSCDTFPPSLVSFRLVFLSRACGSCMEPAKP